AFPCRLTWRFVERGFRYRPTRAKTAALASAVAVIGLAGIGIYAAGGVPSRFGSDVEIVTRDYKSEAEAAYRSGSCFLTSGTQFAATCDDAQPSDAPRIVLWGDSHAAHLYPGLRELQRARGTFRLSQYTAALCPPIFGFEAKRAMDCAALNQAVRQRLIELKPDTVIMAAQQWHDYDGPDRDPAAVDQLIRTTLADLKSFGVRRIVVIGRMPAWRMTPPRILAQALRTQAAGLGAASLPTRDSTHLWSSYADDNERLRRFFTEAGAEFISPTQTLCNQDRCLLTVPDRGAPIAFDGSHLTVAGSRYYVKAIADQLLRE
ncbi:SGNH hydrolase domain-containing protein, partial [Rhodopseudomonas sp. B29]|uniref:SGNH hydrolase domain-containing protein n=1 Tax=Rhodopseudomonas sp. B29 TaxID=95607 RepID=UPI0003B50F51